VNLLDVQYFGGEIPQDPIYQKNGAENARVAHPAGFEKSHGNFFVKLRTQVIRQFVPSIA
jgi:hypothetical protein